LLAVSTSPGSCKNSRGAVPLGDIVTLYRLRVSAAVIGIGGEEEQR